MIAASVKACIVNVLHIPFQNTPYPGALDLYFMFLVILPDAGAISTSAEFLLYVSKQFIPFNNFILVLRTCFWSISVEFSYFHKTLSR